MDTLAGQRRQISDRLAHAHREIVQLDQQRGFRHRGDRGARRLVLANQISNLTDRIEHFDEELERARDAHRQHRDYVTEHRDELQRLPDVQRAIDTRFAQLVDADVPNPPRYLRTLGPPPVDPAGIASWRRAAEFVERYRVDHYITDQYRALGPEPKGDAAILWRMKDRHLEMLTAQVREPLSELDAGVELA